MRNLIISVGVLAAAVGGMFAIQRKMSQLDEDIVYAHYQDEVNAMRRLDAKALCGMMAKDYRHVEIERTAEGEARIELGRDDACTAIQASMRALYKIAKPMKIAPDVKYTIESVGTETLVRTLGEVRAIASETRGTANLR